MGELNITPAHIYPRATQEIPQIIEMVEKLVANGHAYATEDGDVYFDVRRDADYGKLSGRDVASISRDYARVESGEQKRDPADFALWKAAKPGEPSWESPWGPGRPGWHIECSAMSYRYLGAQLDIHGGGQDLIFPHHENEIAQSEAYTGVKPFVRHWIHNGWLTLGEEKMSKSLGNIITIRDALDTLRRGRPAHLRADRALPGAAQLQRREPRVRQARGGAPAHRRDAARPGRPAFRHQAGGVPPALRRRHGRRPEHGGRAGLALRPGARDQPRPRRRPLRSRRPGDAADARRRARPDPGASARATGGAEPFIDLLMQLRNDLRAAKQFQLADSVRDRLADLGITLEDGAEGTRWRRRD